MEKFVTINGKPLTLHKASYGWHCITHNVGSFTYQRDLIGALKETV